MPIKFECPQCGRSLSVPESDIGLIALCNACGSRLRVPGAAERSAAVPSLASLWAALGTEAEIGAPPEDHSSDAAPTPPPPGEGSRESDAPNSETFALHVSVPSAGAWVNSRPWETPAVGADRALPMPPQPRPVAAVDPEKTLGPGATTIKAFVQAPPPAPESPHWPISPPPRPQPLHQRLFSGMDATQWTLMGAAFVCSLLLVLVVYVAINRFDTPAPVAWDEAHRGEIRAQIDAADSRVIAGDLPSALKAYTKVEDFVRGRVIGDPALRADLDRVSSNRHKIVAALSDRALTVAPVASVPVGVIVPTPVSTPTTSTPPQPPGPATMPAVTEPVRAVALKVSRQAATEDSLSDAAIEQSIRRGVDWLIARFGDAGVMKSDEAERRNALNALAVYALLQCSYAIHDERLDVHGPFMQKLLEKLDASKMEEGVETYGRGIRATALSLFNRPQDRQVLAADLGWLLRTQKNGAYSYNEKQLKDGNWDNSNSQYGLLGVWAAAEAGFEVSGPYWKQVQDHWTNEQSQDGSWGYNLAGSGSIPMTAAGIATLFVTHDYLDAVRFGKDVGRAPFPPALVRGLAWLEREDRVMQVKANGYGLYGIERVGLASGFKFLGGHDWFKEHSRDLLTLQQQDGSWGDPVEHCFALLFLARGSHPVLMNKLRFNGAWANRPRDVANLAHFASNALERPLNWQVVEAAKDATDYADSPILYLASHEAPKLEDEQIEQLARYVESGGLLFTQADGGSTDFDRSAHELARKLFPRYPMTPLASEHAVYSTVFPIDKAVRPPLMAVSNGARLLMIHSPADITQYWQQRDEKSHPIEFQFGINLFIYATGKASLRHRLVSPNIPEPPSPTGGTVKVARLRYDGNWDPEPGAWKRFGRWFTRETSCGIENATFDLGQLQPGLAPLAHLTGAAPFKPSEAEIEAVRRYVDGGGTLLIDVCGGNNADCVQSMTALLAAAFPDAQLRKLSAAHPVFSAAAPGMKELASDPDLRPYATYKLGKGAGRFEGLVHGHGHVIFTSLDLTSGLLGTQTWAITGYDPDYAQAFLKNLILWTAVGRPGAGAADVR